MTIEESNWQISAFECCKTKKKYVHRVLLNSFTKFHGLLEGRGGGDLGHEIVDVACLPQTALEMRLWGHLRSLTSEPLWKPEDLVAS